MAHLSPHNGDKPLVIGTRNSKLAMWQAKYAQRLLTDITDQPVDIKGILSFGDKDQNTALSKFSDKGIFTKELDVALLENTIDCAVHCTKDLPTAFHQDLAIACYFARGVKNDVVLIDKIRHPTATCISDLPTNSVIGTGSLRRQSLLRSCKFPNNVSVSNIRGNLNTRLRKLVVDKLYDAIILAEIGVDRLGWMNRTDDDMRNDPETDQNALKINVFPLSEQSFPYAVGQGALAVMCRQKEVEQQSELYQTLRSLNDFHCEMCCKMERNLLRILEGGCKVPIACRSGIFVQCPYCELWNTIQLKKCQACWEPLFVEKVNGNVHVNGDGNGVERGDDVNVNVNGDENGNGEGSDREDVKTNGDVKGDDETVNGDTNHDGIQLGFILYGVVITLDGNTKIEATEYKMVRVKDFDMDKLNVRRHLQYRECLSVCRTIGADVAHKLREQGAQKIIDKIKLDALNGK